MYFWCNLCLFLVINVLFSESYVIKALNGYTQGRIMNTKLKVSEKQNLNTIEKNIVKDLSNSLSNFELLDTRNYPDAHIMDRSTKADLAIEIIGGSCVNFARVYDDDSVADCLREMNKVNRGSALVFDKNTDQLSGIFTERDLVSKILTLNRDASNVLIKEAMSNNVITGTPDLSVLECQQIMSDNKIRHLPIIDDMNMVLGLIGMSDVLAILRQEPTTINSGSSVEDAKQLTTELANQLALSEEYQSQDPLRVGFVLLAAALGGLILQGEWVHGHEALSMTATFILGYAGIIFEENFGFDKSGVALLMSTALWVIFAGTAGASGVAIPEAIATLGDKMQEVSEVVYFLLGAMTIVEIVDSHQGFKVVTDAIDAKDKRGLLWTIGLLTFFMSAILDNLTTTIVMVSLMKKLLADDEDRKIFGAMIVIAANAGGAWTPIGDVTTTMLWINGQISAVPTMISLLLPSLISTLLSIGLLQNEFPPSPPRG